MKKMLLFSVLLLLINGCSKDENDIEDVIAPIIETFTITADHTNIKSLQIVTITIPEAVQLTNQIYTAKFDATEITLSRNELNKLSFMAPDLPSKAYNFLIEINGKRANLNFTLQAIENIENVAVFLESEMLTPLKEINKIANIELNNPNINVKEKELIEFGNEFYSKANTAYNGLSFEDKQKLRKFLLANEISLKGIIDKTISKKGYGVLEFDVEVWYKNMDELSQKLLIYEAALGGIIGATAILIAIPDVTWTKLAALASAAAGVYLAKDYFKARTELVDKSFYPYESFIKTMFDNKTQNSKMSSEVYNFQNNITKNLTIQSSGRRFQKSDISHPNSKISAVTSIINKGDLVWNQFKESIDKLINKIGSFFNITQNKITSTTGLPEKSAEEVITLDNKYFKIDNVPSAIIQQLTIKDESTLQLKFSTQGELPSTFDAKLKYDDGVFKSESDFKVSLLSNISLSGSLDFGEKFLKSSTKKSLTISNKLNVPVTITSIALPSGFESNWSGGSIPASGSREVEITFNPVDPKDYSGTIVVKNNIDESSATINVTAIGIGGISLLGDLDFGKVEIGKTVEKFFIIKNESSSIMEISFITMPIGYTSNWRVNGNIILNPNTGTTISIVFKPTEALVYNGFIDVINSVDNSSNSRTSIKGEGISGIDLVIGIWKLVKSYVFDQGAWEEIVYESCKLLDRSIFEENGVWKYTEFSNIDGVCIQDMDNGFINGSWKKNSDGSYQIKLKYIEEGEFTETWIISFPTSNTMKVIYNVNDSDYTLFSRVE